MYEDIYYVANIEDEENFRSELWRIGLCVLPERPGGQVSLSPSAINADHLRLLSLRPIEQVVASDTLPYPHYSPAAQPLIEWEPPKLNGKVLIAAHLRYHAYMLKKGPEYAEIGKAFTQIKAWLKAHWEPINQFDFMGPGAARLINEEGYTWSAFDPAQTKVETVRADGMTEELGYDQWMKTEQDR
ncbi:MAG: hypothetical protein IV086_06330 [Hyphomonadaceae bacterium]|nr:MAG: hypothetical protein FD160_2876 [Caulobacteraceae bacterium]MBT9445298.1 hypothetical protein [Hyphomonadaceae bacterium]